MSRRGRLLLWCADVAVAAVAVALVGVLAWVVGESGFSVVRAAAILGISAGLLWATRLEWHTFGLGTCADVRACFQSALVTALAGWLLFPVLWLWAVFWVLLGAALAAGRVGFRWLQITRGVWPQPPVPLWPNVSPPTETTDGEMAVVFSLTPATDEPRLRRQCAAWAAMGWAPVVIGLSGRSPKPPPWTLIEVTVHSPSVTTMERAFMRLWLFATRFSGFLAEQYLWHTTGYARLFRDAVERLPNRETRAVLANDYFTAPLAARLARRLRVDYFVDVHEYAVEQNAADPSWCFWQRPWIDALQRRFYPRARGLSTVCEGIAELLERDYDLPASPAVVRSTPQYQAMPFRPCRRDRIDVLYHGILAPDRGLEQAVESVPLWREELRLVIRGPGPAEYVESLAARVARCGVRQRVIFAEPVPFFELIDAANRADVGLFVQPNHSAQKRLALPNKLFEYIMAGLALCVIDLPEMAKVVTRYRVGRLVAAATPHAIAEAVNTLSAADIDAYKNASLVAARELSWENESRVFQALFAQP